MATFTIDISAPDVKLLAEAYEQEYVRNEGEQDVEFIRRVLSLRIKQRARGWTRSKLLADAEKKARETRDIDVSIH